MNTNPSASHTTTPLPASTTTGPLVFQYETPQGHRYHVAGQGFTAEHLRDATRYPVEASWSSVPLDLFVPDGGHLTALAVVEISSIEETAIRASWGDQPLVLSPTNFHSEAFTVIRPLLDGLVNSRGVPFGSSLTVLNPESAKSRRAIFNLGFQLPRGVAELLTPLSPSGASTPREILNRIAVLGLQFSSRSEPQGFSNWQREIGGITLILETGSGCQPESLALRAKDADPVVIRLAGRTFTEIHPLLVSFISAAKSSSPDQALEVFENTFVESSSRAADGKPSFLRNVKAPLNPAYRIAVFEYIPDGKPEDFWVITAYNPDGIISYPVENLAADERLRVELISLGLEAFRIIGKSSDDSHAESGWGLPCDEATALEIGRRYRQEALFHFHDGRIELVNCDCGSRQLVDEIQNRIHDPRDVRHFTLTVGSSKGRRNIDDREYQNIRNRVGTYFKGFTIQRAEGCFGAETEDTLLIHIATRETEKVLHLAHQLRVASQQIGIGISHNGIYQRARDWTDDGLILQSFGISLKPIAEKSAIKQSQENKKSHE